MGVPVIEGGTAWDDVTGERSLANGFGKESFGVEPFDTSSRGQFSGRFPTTHPRQSFLTGLPSGPSTIPSAARPLNWSPYGCNSRPVEGQSERAVPLRRYPRSRLSFRAGGQVVVQAPQHLRGRRQIARSEREHAAGHRLSESQLPVSHDGWSQLPVHDGLKRAVDRDHRALMMSSMLLVGRPPGNVT